ncbi:hypothetical protein [Clostridium estertheticum]|uniref:hypothetical protein n=1 Tax=Clostridium estertheticum TaxID=238834 RepID=UPI001C0B855C|nr:hypothetical protein [Clostridium estertheticum]MBU3217422.1 hypothetical protein [Clostridium estertheticum]
MNKVNNTKDTKKSAWSLDNLPRLEGKNFIITGANSGIGFEAARAFARNGM